MNSGGVELLPTKIYASSAPAVPPAMAARLSGNGHPGESQSQLQFGFDMFFSYQADLLSKI